jgi:hypothetical protein
MATATTSESIGVGRREFARRTAAPLQVGEEHIGPQLPRGVLAPAVGRMG